MIISEAYKLYENDKILENYSKNTLKGYKIQYNLLIRYFNDIDINLLNVGLLKEYLSKQTHLKSSSLGMRIRFLKSFFRYCFEERIIEINISKKLKEPRLGQRIPRYLTEEEILVLEESCKTPLEKCLIIFTFATGCRIGEIYNMNKSDIDWQNRSLKVIGKGDKEREVFFNIKSFYWLKKYLAQRKDNDPALFVTERKPHRMSTSEMRYIMKRIAKRTDIKSSVYFHRLRHSHCITLMENGMPIEHIKENVGHVKIQTTMIYLYLTNKSKKEAYDKYFK